MDKIKDKAIQFQHSEGNRKYGISNHWYHQPTWSRSKSLTFSQNCQQEIIVKVDCKTSVNRNLANYQPISITLPAIVTSFIEMIILNGTTHIDGMGIQISVFEHVSILKI